MLQQGGHFAVMLDQLFQALVQVAVLGVEVPLQEFGNVSFGIVHVLDHCRPDFSHQSFAFTSHGGAVYQAAGLAEGQHAYPEGRCSKMIPIRALFALQQFLDDLLVGHPKVQIKFGGRIPEQVVLRTDFGLFRSGFSGHS